VAKNMYIRRSVFYLKLNSAYRARDNLDLSVVLMHTPLDKWQDMNFDDSVIHDIE
jgi:hypothetical protein